MDVAALLIYIIVQCITPGPSNLMSLYSATTVGYNAARPYRVGTSAGYVIKMLFCGILNLALASILPGLVPYLKWAGAAYLIYLAVHIIYSGRKQNSDNEKKHVSATFWGGILLQALNMKSWVMGITLFSVYVIPYTTKMLDILLWTGIAGAFMLTATLTWSLAGTVMKKVYAKYRLAFDIVFALLLVYSAISAIM